jgi:uncharacterized protein (TIGR02466 family)
MQYLNLFPTSVFTDYQPDIVSDYLPVANEYLEKYGKKFDQREHSNINHISTYNMQESVDALSNDKRMDKLTAYLVETAKNFLNYQNVDGSSYELEPFYLFNKIGKYSGHGQHAHPESIISGCIYLQAYDDSSPLIFKDPRPIDKYYYYKPIYNRLAETYKLFPEYSVPVYTGLVLMWNSWLEHEIPICYSDKERITVAFNLSR